MILTFHCQATGGGCCTLILLTLHDHLQIIGGLVPSVLGDDMIGVLPSHALHIEVLIEPWHGGVLCGSWFVPKLSAASFNKSLSKKLDLPSLPKRS